MDEAEATLARAYIQRVKELRVARGMTQQEMADALGISLDRYKKYENRSVLPPYLLDRFAAVVNKDITYVVTGRPPKRP
jgi:transcriptional regulator with XRE-family HTH domain